MSTRYVWEKYFVVTSTTKRTTKSYNYIITHEGVSTPTIAVAGSTYKESFGSDGVLFSIVNGKSIPCNDGEEKMFGTPAHKYVVPLKNSKSLSGDEMLSLLSDYGDYTYSLSFYAKRNGSQVVITLEGHSSPSEPDVKQSFYVNTAVGSKGDYISTVSNGSRSAYSDNGITSVNWYVYKGSDNIDPISVIYSKPDLEAGEPVTITVSPRTPTYGGTIYYQYQYSTDGGNTWTSLGSKTTATSKSITIPEEVEQFQARVLASDSWGFTSTTYVNGPNVPVSQIKAYATIDGKNRAGNKIYVTVDSKIRVVAKGYVTVNGIIRKLF